ncbi:VOC family protein [Azospirillum sp. ST 5-10]|uniref:VOC family protein n=1 Tax=unclassified Azospirillum TaxID=2630922 RepID=UPI003F4A6440
MTQLRSRVLPTRRPGELGVHSIDGFHLVVPDLADAQRFYGAFGLDVREGRGGLDLHTFDHPHRWGTVAEGPRKRFSHISFGVFADEFAAFKRHLEILGVALVDPPPGCESDGLWLRNPDGLLMEVRAAEKSSPSEKSRFDPASAPPGAQGSHSRSASQPVRPRRLAHILLFTADIDAAIGFYTRVLGLRLSDRSGDLVAFLHGIHGSDHHMVALAKSTGPGLHHLSWDVGSVHDVGLGAMLMAERGFSQGWGLGRHVLGSNYFHYVRDPWGSYAEYSADIDFVPAHCDWQATDHPVEDSFYVWGPPPPPDFTVNHEAAA